MKLWEVIEFLNEEKVLLYKHPYEDFYTNSKLIVREGQTAMFVKNGRVLDIFTPGRYALRTENIPLLSNLFRHLTTGGQNSYSAELFFVSTVDQFNMKWGTRTPMDVLDPLYKIVVKLGACGEAAFCVTDPLKFIQKMSGTSTRLDAANLNDYFRSIINSYVKNCISDALSINKISVLYINSCLVNISDSSCDYLNQKIEEYGIRAKNFTVDTINIPEGDPSLMKLRSILEKKAEMELLGYSYQEERSFDVMENISSNDATVGVANSLMGIGLGFGLAGPIGKKMAAVSDIVSGAKVPGGPIPDNSRVEQENNDGWTCPTCGKTGLSGLFCSECGTKKSNEWTCVCGSVNKDAKFCPNCGRAFEK